MNDPQSPACPSVRILFLARSESSVRMDTRLLRGLGLCDITHISESAQAMLFLENNFFGAREGRTPGPAEIVISDENLADVPASVFLYAMARHPHLKSQPVLVLTGTAESSRRLRAAGVYLLERPYTAEGLARMLQKAASPLRRTLKTEAFERASAQKGILLQQKRRKAAPKPFATTTSDWYNKGLDCLRLNDLDGAESAFSHVLTRQEDHVEASIGLARIYRARADENSMRRYLLRAAAICLRGGDKTRAGHIAAVLPAHMRDSIFFYEATARMEEGEFKAAALGFLDTARENSGQKLHQIVSRACLLTGKPEESMRSLCAAFAGMGYKAIADHLHQRLLVYPEFTPAEPRSWLDACPRLRDAVDVISGTALAWRHA